MFNCPSCKTDLNRGRNSVGVFWECPSCHGKAITLETAGKTVPRNIISTLVQKAKLGTFPQKRQCVSCERLMNEIPITHENKVTCLDVCPVCRLIWFDMSEYESVSTIQIEEKGKDISPRTREMLALADITKINEIAEVKDIQYKWYSRRHGLLGIIFEIYRSS
jgi:Zn-finger nucleic acid-binding protein